MVGGLAEGEPLSAPARAGFHYHGSAARTLLQIARVKLGRKVLFLLRGRLFISPQASYFSQILDDTYSGPAGIDCFSLSRIMLA